MIVRKRAPFRIDQYERLHLLYEKGKETFAELGEVVDDLIAEAKSEIAESHAQAAPGAGPET